MRENNNRRDVVKSQNKKITIQFKRIYGSDD